MQSGTDIALVSTGEITYEVIKAQKELEKYNINCEVIHISSLRPLNEEKLIELLKNMKYIFILEEHSIHGGLGSVIAQNIIGKVNCKTLKILGMNEVFGQSGKIEDLRKHYGLDYISVTNMILQTIRRK